MAVCVGFSAGSLASGKYDDDYDDDDDKYYSSYSDSKYDDSDDSSSYSDSKYDDSDDSSSYSNKEDDGSYSGSYSHSYSSTYQSSGGKDYSGDGHSGGDGYSSGDDSDGYKDDDDGDKKRLALNLVGTGKMYPDTVPPLEKYGPPLDAQCFDVELKNIHDGEQIGWATDCLSEVEGTPETGLQLIGTTFFYLPDGLLITRGHTTVQPVLKPTVTVDGQYISHITGASSDENAVVKGYGEYQWHRGTVRLSGMVDVTEFAGNEGDPMFFDCLFVIDLHEYKPEFKTWYDWYRYRYYRDSYYEEYHSDSYYGKYDDSNDSSYDDSGYDDSGYDSDDRNGSRDGSGSGYKNSNKGKDKYDKDDNDDRDDDKYDWDDDDDDDKDNSGKGNRGKGSRDY
ncbi:hypothetical protein BIZ37_06660 [Photobacterium sp. BZF1]|nr:hypothetical protein [Photobacterium sp. BZF1]